MKVSAVIATYNRAAMVVQAVEAALAQTRPPDEIVVADDASPDGTWAALEELAARDSRIRIFRRERNSGGVDNWNFALRQATGDVLAWCSDDDRWLPRHLEQSIAYLEWHREAAMVHASFVDAIETSSGVECVPRPFRFGAPHAVDRHNALWYITRHFDWPFHPSTLVLRREVWERTGEFDPRYAFADTDWFLRAAEQFRIVMLPLHGVLNRRHAGNWSNRMGSAHLQREIFEIVERAITRRAMWQRPMWRALWRANARARLLLTIRARVRSGHGDAASAAWSALAHGTGVHLPGWMDRAGDAWIRRRSAGQAGAPRESVSPL